MGLRGEHTIVTTAKSRPGHTHDLSLPRLILKIYLRKHMLSAEIGEILPSGAYTAMRCSVRANKLTFDRFRVELYFR
jgi:hypothetical protein